MGEGGAVYTNNPLLHRIIRSFRDWGRDCVCTSGQDNSCGHRFDKQYGELPLGQDVWSDFRQITFQSELHFVLNIVPNDFFLFWIGVYPGMTDEMLDYMAEVIHNGVKQQLSKSLLNYIQNENIIAIGKPLI